MACSAAVEGLALAAAAVRGGQLARAAIVNLVQFLHQRLDRARIWSRMRAHFDGLMIGVVQSSLVRQGPSRAGLLHAAAHRDPSRGLSPSLGQGLGRLPADVDPSPPSRPPHWIKRPSGLGACRDRSDLSPSQVVEESFRHLATDELPTQMKSTCAIPS